MFSQNSHLVNPILSDITLGELYQEWASTKYRNIAKGTMHCYMAGWNRLSKYANLKVKDLRTEHFQEVIDFVIDAKKSRSTLEKQRTLSVMLWDYALKNGVVDTNYARSVKLPKIERPKKVKDPRLLAEQALKKKEEKARNVIFRERVRKLLKEKQMSREDLGAKIGLAPKEPERYLDGVVRTPLWLLEKIADFFGVSADYLIGADINNNELKIQTIQRAYTMASPKDKKYIMGMVDMMLEKIEGERG